MYLCDNINNFGRKYILKGGEILNEEKAESIDFNKLDVKFDLYIRYRKYAC
ncbi:hypothetical protein CLOSBL3_10619 [Clostridiaceae bacterium BL-3]|nr:hypothetical protein CLOSBL3_10619 [Clostridiaceae bacterium BL-3]